MDVYVKTPLKQSGTVVFIIKYLLRNTGKYSAVHEQCVTLNVGGNQVWQKSSRVTTSDNPNLQ